MSNVTKRPSRWRRSATWPLVAALALGACGEEATTEPPEFELPEEPELASGEGRWQASQRGVAIDEEDDPVIQRGPGGGGGIGTERIQSDFGLLVLNRPYIDNRFAECTPADEAADKRPLARSQDVIDVVEAKGLTFDSVAVNVDLLSPSRTTLVYQCFQRGNALPRFGAPEHREAVKQAFVELAALPNLKYVTVGLDLNRYYHLRLEGGSSPQNIDYANLVTLYREVYAAIKQANPNVKVGPGISWPTFRGTTVREIALEYGLDPEADALEAVYRAYLRTVEPLLFQGSGAQRKATADFLGVSVVPSPAESPYAGNPAPEGDDRERVLEFYRHLPLVSGGLPVAFPQLDWPIRSDGLAVQKSAFLELFQQATSHVRVEFAAWRRLSDLTRTEGSNKCTAYTGGPIAPLRHPEDYCYAGLINESGAVRDVLDVLTADPSETPPAE